MRTRLLSLAVLASLAVCGPASAHHSAAMFDTTKCLAVSGTVRNFEWRFPHTWVWVVAPTKAGGTEIWGFETPAPSQLVRIDQRWNGKALEKGQKVKVRYAPLRDGRNGGLMNSIDLLDGRVLHGAPNSFKCEEELYGPSKATQQEAKDRAGKP